jgi:hypothetical protein
MVYTFDDMGKFGRRVGSQNAVSPPELPVCRTADHTAAHRIAVIWSLTFRRSGSCATHLFFIKVEPRQVHLAEITVHPSGTWVTQYVLRPDVAQGLLQMGMNHRHSHAFSWPCRARTSLTVSRRGDAQATLRR